MVDSKEILVGVKGTLPKKTPFSSEIGSPTLFKRTIPTKNESFPIFPMPAAITPLNVVRSRKKATRSFEIEQGSSPAKCTCDQRAAAPGVCDERCPCGGQKKCRSRRCPCNCWLGAPIKEVPGKGGRGARGGRGKGARGSEGKGKGGVVKVKMSEEEKATAKAAKAAGNAAGKAEKAAAKKEEKLCEYVVWASLTHCRRVHSPPPHIPPFSPPPPPPRASPPSLCSGQRRIHCSLRDKGAVCGPARSKHRKGLVSGG